MAESTDSLQRSKAVISMGTVTETGGTDKLYEVVLRCFLSYKKWAQFEHNSNTCIRM